MWETKRLGDCIDLQSGGTPSKRNADYWGGEIPWVSCKDMKTSRLYQSKDTLTNIGSVNGTRMVEPGTILIVVRGMILAKDFPVAIAMKKMTFNQDLKAVTTKNGLSSEFLYYWMLANKWQLMGIADEAAHGTKRIQTDRLLNLEIDVPSLSEQQATVKIFKAYDDLIENNNRRIVILEEMAQSLYREWFIKFRFPGYESAKFIDSPLGNIPEGWEVKKLADVASINTESITNKNAPDNIRYIDIKSVGIGTIDEIKPMPFSEAPSRARRIVRDGDIIWATVRPNRKQYSFIAKPEENTVVSTGFAVIRAEKVPDVYLVQALSTDGFVSYLVNHATGAAYPAVNAKDFENADILVPDIEVLVMFGEISSTATMQCEVLKRKNRNLVKQRDMLLPKLISGAISLNGNKVVAA